MILPQQPNVSKQVESDFALASAQAYENLGCPALALVIIKEFRLANVEVVHIVSDSDKTCQVKGENQQEKETLDFFVNPIKKNDEFSWDEPVSTSVGLDWGEMTSTLESNTSGIDWGEMEKLPDSNFERQELNALDNPTFSNSLDVIEQANPLNSQQILEMSELEWVKYMNEKKHMKEYTWILSMRILQVKK